MFPFLLNLIANPTRYSILVQFSPKPIILMCFYYKENKKPTRQADFCFLTDYNQVVRSPITKVFLRMETL